MRRLEIEEMVVERDTKKARIIEILNKIHPTKGNGLMNSPIFSAFNKRNGRQLESPK
jgi:hypothetical protein